MAACCENCICYYAEQGVCRFKPPAPMIVRVTEMRRDAQGESVAAIVEEVRSFHSPVEKAGWCAQHQPKPPAIPGGSVSLTVPTTHIAMEPNVPG